jgi:arginyl-tRNA--protein-N-Asp/Glu arginylyltransferase
MDDLSSGQLQSAYPSHAPPVSVRLTISPEHDCSYFPQRRAITRAFWAQAMPGELYRQFMVAGFRRSGKVIYQPICSQCRACVPIRVPVTQFAPDKSQRRCWRKNQDLIVSADVPEPTAEKHELYERYRRHWHASGEGHDWETFTSFLYDSPVETLEFSYRDSAGKLLGVGICDVCEQSLSTVYFYFEPQEARRGLGTFSALWEIDWARRAAIPHYYLGYWVGGCGAMEYKSSFKPCELLGTDGVWRERID